jgi:hypothetical protein
MTQSASPARTLALKISSRFGTGRVLSIFAVIYAVQAAFGITAGVAYAVWLLYW